MSVESFTVHKNTRDKREQREVWDSAKRIIHAIPKNIDGYAIVAYHRMPGGFHATHVNYFVRDSMDKHSLPDMAKTLIQSALDK